MLRSTTILTSLALTGAVVGQQALTVPSAYEAQDATTHLWVAGFAADLRQQTVIDAWHLQAMVGRPITALAWRRNAENDAFAGGTVNLTVRLAHTSVSALTASESFAVNLGAQSVLVWDGPVTVPPSPPMVGPVATWGPNQIVRLPLTTPFTYQGGNLMVDVVGYTTGTQSVGWWPADAVFDPTSGSVQSVGVGCGSQAGASGQWALVAPTSLIPGASAQLMARGDQSGLTIVFIGAPASLPGVPLTVFLPEASPACRVYLPVVAGFALMSFGSVVVPGLSGEAYYTFPIPNQPWALGASFGSQWLDLQQNFATSNAVNATIASTLPSLGMSVVRGVPSDARGTVVVNQAHVLRFEFQ